MGHPQQVRNTPKLASATVTRRLEGGLGQLLYSRYISEITGIIKKIISANQDPCASLFCRFLIGAFQIPLACYFMK